MTRLKQSHYGSAGLHAIRRPFSVCLVIFIALLQMSSSFTAAASNISEEFNSDESYPRGTIVSVKRDLPDDVELTSLSNSQFLLGVVNNETESVINFNKDNANVSVALTGEVRVLVTDANGPIKRGDFIGASWLKGVGMLAVTDEEQKLVGVAQENFNLSQAEEYGEIETSSGIKDVKVGSVLVRLFDKESIISDLNGKGGIEGAFTTVIGKDVSLAKILIGSLLFLTSLTIAGMFITSSIRGSFVSIGRNPMAGASIHKGMIRVAILAVVIILTGALVAYAILAV